MSSASGTCGHPCSELLDAFALHALSADEARAARTHVSACSDCQRELEALRRTVDALVAWPTDVLRPPASLWGRIAQRVGPETDDDPWPASEQLWRGPEWEDVAPGISCKLLATDAENNVVSMLVRLAPGVAYPPHTHAGLEELHLLDGELWIDDKKLSPGDYNRAEPGSSDARVWSETGCTCVLITSTRDVLR
jgi:quercetin dioxygenase-like cupin family protein